MAIPKPSVDWMSEPLVTTVPKGQWNNYKGYSNFLSKGGLRARSKGRGAEALKEMQECRYIIQKQVRLMCWVNHMEHGELILCRSKESANREIKRLSKNGGKWRFMTNRRFKAKNDA